MMHERRKCRAGPSSLNLTRRTFIAGAAAWFCAPSLPARASISPTLASTDVLTVSMIDRVIACSRAASPRIWPTLIGGREFYVVVGPEELPWR